MHTSPGGPVPTNATDMIQASPKTGTQVGGTQTSPPPSPQKATLTGGTQTTTPRDPHQDQGNKGQPDHNWENDDDQQTHDEGKGKSRGKRSKKKPSQDPSPCPGMSQTNTIPRTNFTSRNLGTGKPTIQCTACGEYTHWRRECQYDNFCTTCNNHKHATHMCKALRQATNGQQSPSICVYCVSAEHSSATCHKRPWDNREQPCGTPKTLRNQQNQLCNSKKCPW